MDWAAIAGAAGAFVGGMIARFISGDTSPEVRRVIDVLPGEMRADIEAARQRAAAEEEFKAALDGVNG